MPVTPGYRLKFRGKQRLLLRRVIKLSDEVLSNNNKYAGTPKQDTHVILTPALVVQLAAASVEAVGQLHAEIPKSGGAPPS